MGDRLLELRAQLQALEARAPVDEREAAARATMLRALAVLPRPFDEHADPTHVTSSAIVISERGVLLHRHKRLGTWMQPGGHVDAGETTADAVLREVLEETGLIVTHAATPPAIVHVDVHPGGRGHIHLDLRYLLRAPADDPAPSPGESQSMAWFALSDAIALADEALRGFLVHLQRQDLRTA